MRISKYTVSMILALVLALSVTAFGTVAYMTDRETVTNTFTVGNIDIIVDEEDVDGSKTDPTPDGIVNPPSTPALPEYPQTDVDGDGLVDKIEIDENGNITITYGDTTKPSVPIVPNADGTYPDTDVNGDNILDKITVGTDGTITIVYGDDTDDETDNESVVIVPVKPSQSAGRDKANEYKLIPGATYTKDPTMTILANSEECYVRMIVELKAYDVLQQITEKSGQELLAEFVTIDNTNWIFHNDVVNAAGDVVTFEYRYKDKVSTSTAHQTLEPLFETFTVPVYFTGDHLNLLGDTFELNVDGQAVQTAVFADANEAWAKFKEQHGE